MSRNDEYPVDSRIQYFLPLHKGHRDRIKAGNLATNAAMAYTRMDYTRMAIRTI